MRAIISSRYGSPESLQIKELPKPVPGPTEVVIKVRAVAINDYDWSMVRGRPYLYRLLFGLFRPKHQIPGMELAGTIESVGEQVTSLNPGDAVYGDISEFGFGAFAEYCCIDERAVVIKPAEMSFEVAASISHASMLAYQGLFDSGGLKKGQKILINGAGGGVGTFGFQMAKLLNAEVTGVDTGEKLDMMKSLGFDYIIDYKNEDFTRNGVKYDLVLDTKTTRSPWAYLRSLSPGGHYVTVGGTIGRLLQLFLLGALLSRSKKYLKIVALKPNKDLEYIHDLYKSGAIKCIIDGPYQLDEVPRLIRYFGEGKHTGKVIVTV